MNDGSIIIISSSLLLLIVNNFQFTDVQEQTWLPPPYSGLVRGTPVSQPGTSPAPQPAGIIHTKINLLFDTYKSFQTNIRINTSRIFWKQPILIG